MESGYLVTLVLLMPLLCAGQSLVPVMNPVLEGSVFKGYCNRPSAGGPVIVLVNGMEGRVIIDVSTLGSNSTSFTLPDVSRRHNGAVLTCLELPFSSVIGNLTLEVLFSPNFTSGYFDENVKLGMPFSRCLSLEANPDIGNNFTWTKNGVNYTGNVSATSIYIPIFTENDTGIYTVTATNFLGSTNASFAVTQYKPKLENYNGKLSVSWGFSLNVLVVTCRNEEESGSGLFTICAGSNNTCDDRMTVIPTGSENVTAGRNYSCTIATSNKNDEVKLKETNYLLITSGIPSVPIITSVTVGTRKFLVNVKLYAGHTSLSFNVSVIDEQNTVTHVSVSQTGVTSGLMNYTIVVPFNKSGRYRFAVSASNPFGRSTMKSDVYPPPENKGLAVIMPLFTNTYTIPSPTQPSSTLFGIFVGVIVGLIVIILILILVILSTVIIVVIRKNQRCKSDNIETIKNEAYYEVRRAVTGIKEETFVQTTPVAQLMRTEGNVDMHVYEFP